MVFFGGGGIWIFVMCIVIMVIFVSKVFKSELYSVSKVVLCIKFVKMLFGYVLRVDKVLILWVCLLIDMVKVLKSVINIIIVIMVFIMLNNWLYKFLIWV